MLTDTLVVSMLVLTVNIIPYVYSFDRSYVIKKDFFNGLTSPKFSIYDKTEKNLKYRIESRFSLRHNNEIVAYPSKKVVGKLNLRLSLLRYNADISLLNQSSNRWINGNITETSNWRTTEFTTYWNGNCIILKSKFDILSNEFYEKGRGEVLARFKKRPASRLWAAKYDMEIFSIEFPQALYFLAVAVHELKSSRRGKK